LNEIIESFLDSLDADLAAIEQAFDQGHLAVRAAAHSLKGSAGNLALRRLAAWASTLEKKALAGDLDACRGLMSVMLQLADASRQALRAYMAAS
jgi:HPt (histidine-containing phosphotransfer) domain-containing protein